MALSSGEEDGSDPKVLAPRQPLASAGLGQFVILMCPGVAMSKGLRDTQSPGHRLWPWGAWGHADLRFRPDNTTEGLLG